jgi:hypothetical protein
MRRDVHAFAGVVVLGVTQGVVAEGVVCDGDGCPRILRQVEDGWGVRGRACGDSNRAACCVVCTPRCSSRCRQAGC